MRELSRKETAQLLNSMEGKILITTHKNPDGDAIGSSVALYNYLKKLGKDVRIIYKDRVPYFFDFLPGVENVELKDSIDEKFDWVIVTDVSEKKRTGFETIPAKNSLVIDHHITAEPFSDFYIVEPEISSTCELCYYILKILNENLITKEVALPIYTGMVTDTGSFSYTNTSYQTHLVASELIKKGAEPYLVRRNIFERNRINKFKLLELVLRTLEFAVDGKVAHITVYQKFLKETGALMEETEGFINYPRSIQGVEVAVFFKEMEEGSWKVSLRSKGKINVAFIAKKFGGGGHVMAAGFEFEGDLEIRKEKLFEEIEKALKEEESSGVSR